MSDEPTLPLLPYTLSNTPVDGSRQQQRIEQGTSPPFSSDPPIFSSDDDPSVENYSNLAVRKKRKFRGPWFNQKGQELATVDGLRETKRAFQRHIDSAVWLGSDSSQDDEDASFSSIVQLNGTEVTSPIMIPPGTRPNARLLQLSPTPSSQSLSPEIIGERMMKSCLERVAERTIEYCLEQVIGNIDLTCLELTSLSNHVIKRLSTFVSISPSMQHESYRPLGRQLQLFLASNKLRRIPGEICNLEELVALSLRNNRLVELPAAIGKLRCLTELNIANNNLQCLPYEILELVSGKSKLTRLITHSNPFFQPIHAETNHAAETNLFLSQKDMDILAVGLEDAEPDKDLRGQNLLWTVEYKYRSQVRFFGKDGVLIKGPVFPWIDSLFSRRLQARASHGNLEILRAPPGDVAKPPSPSPSPVVNIRDTSRAPSLLEMTVKTWSKSPLFSNFNYWLEGVPQGIAHLLDDAKTLREMEAGDRKCTICCRKFVIPRTEWIEWWEIARKETEDTTSPSENIEDVRDRMERIVPLIRKGCSWKCVPEPEPLNAEEGRETLGWFSGYRKDS